MSLIIYNYTINLVGQLLTYSLATLNVENLKIGKRGPVLVAKIGFP